MCGHRYKLSINLIRKDVFKQYFIFRCIPVWNILPDHNFNTNVTKSFKLKLSKSDFNQFYMEHYKRELTLVFSILHGTFMYQCFILMPKKDYLLKKCI